MQHLGLVEKREERKVLVVAMPVADQSSKVGTSLLVRRCTFLDKRK